MGALGGRGEACSARQCSTIWGIDVALETRATASHAAWELPDAHPARPAHSPSCIACSLSASSAAAPAPSPCPHTTSRQPAQSRPASPAAASPASPPPLPAPADPPLLVEGRSSWCSSCRLSSSASSASAASRLSLCTQLLLPLPPTPPEGVAAAAPAAWPASAVPPLRTAESSQSGSAAVACGTACGCRQLPATASTTARRSLRRAGHETQQPEKHAAGSHQGVHRQSSALHDVSANGATRQRAQNGARTCRCSASPARSLHRSLTCPPPPGAAAGPAAPRQRGRRRCRGPAAPWQQQSRAAELCWAGMASLLLDPHPPPPPPLPDAPPAAAPRSRPARRAARRAGGHRTLPWQTAPSAAPLRPPRRWPQRRLGWAPRLPRRCTRPLPMRAARSRRCCRLLTPPSLPPTQQSHPISGSHPVPAACLQRCSQVPPPLQHPPLRYLQPCPTPLLRLLPYPCQQLMPPRLQRPPPAAAPRTPGQPPRLFSRRRCQPSGAAAPSQSLPTQCQGRCRAGQHRRSGVAQEGRLEPCSHQALQLRHCCPPTQRQGAPPPHTQVAQTRLRGLHTARWSRTTALAAL